MVLDESIKGTPGISPVGLKTLALKSDENSFTLQLSDLPFADHPTAVYAYRLECSDHEWHYLDKGNLDISYNGLSYGDYHISVYVLDGEGNFGDEVYALDISVLPPWYLTIWCKVFYLTLLIVFLAWIINSHFREEAAAGGREAEKAEILEPVKARMEFYAANLADAPEGGSGASLFRRGEPMLVSSTLRCGCSVRKGCSACHGRRPGWLMDRSRKLKKSDEMDQAPARPDNEAINGRHGRFPTST